MLSFIEGLLRNHSATSVADFFLWFIVGCFAFFLYQAYSGKQSTLIYQAPNILTSLGILGTFTGIVIGLLEFNFGSTEEINASLPKLLDGLKTAFVTSLAGMLSAIFFKWIDASYFFVRRQNQESPDEITPNHILAELKASNENLLSLKQALAGQEDGSLVGILKLARTDIREAREQEIKRFEKFETSLFEQMQHFAELLAKSATETVIEALRQVIVEFNKNLTEQFGENFKRLDESVKKLVDWQQQYMQQMEQMSEHYAEGVKAIDSTRLAVIDIGEKTAEIPKSMAEMQTVLQVNQHQIQELQRHLEAFVQLKEKATSAMPEIQTNLDKVTSQLSESTEKMKIALLEGATEFGQSVRTTNQAMTEVANNVQNNADQIKETLTDSAQSIGSATRDMMDSLEKGATSLRESVTQSIDGALAGIKSSIEKSVGQMESELNRVLKDSSTGLQDTNKMMLDNLKNSALSLQDSLKQSVEQVLSDVRETMQKTLSAVPAQVQDAVDITSKGINKQIEVMDKQMGDEVTRVITNMGSALVQVTDRFTSDYERLVQKMDAVLRNQPGQR